MVTQNLVNIDSCYGLVPGGHKPFLNQLEQLQCLRSEDNPHPPPPSPANILYWVMLEPKSKEGKVKVTNLKNLSRFYFLILKQTLQAIHILKLLDKLRKYEMDPTSIVGDTEWTRFCPQMDRRTDRQGETSIPPFQLHWSRGYNDDLSSVKYLGFHQRVI